MLFLWITLVMGGTAVVFTPVATAAPDPGVAGTLSLVPGLGQLSNGNGWEGLGWFVTTIGLYLSPNSVLQQIGFDLWQYNLYDAYRDAGARSTTRYTVFENYIGALNPLNLVDPIGAPIVGTAAVFGAPSRYPALKNPVAIVTYGFVGLGEEGLFRGFLFPGFSDLLGSRWLGAIFSSSVFSLAHVTGGSSNLEASPLIQRFVLGMLFSWQVSRNDYDLRKSIFAHAWYDILIDTDSNIRGIRVNVPF